MLYIINYGLGNVRSIANMLKYIGVEARVSAEPAEIAAASKLILPGVGAFDAGMSRLDALGLVPVLNECVQARKTPILGICLGMQLFTRGSEEGRLPGLGWFPARTVRFNFNGVENQHAASLHHPVPGLPSPVASSSIFRLPHMGWNEIHIRQPHPLLENLADPLTGEAPRFYFVHGYHVQADDSALVLAETPYGYPFHSVLGRENILGVQFHPEKSHRYGMKLLENFARWSP